MNCAACEDLLPGVGEKDFPSDLARIVESHLGGCAACGRTLQALRRTRAALASQPPRVQALGPAFTASIMRRVRAEARIGFRRRWGGLVAASLLLALGLKTAFRHLPAIPLLTPGGFRVFRSFGNLEEPYEPGAPLNPGDIVVAERGGRIPIGGRILRVGPGGIVWVPGPKPAGAGKEHGENGLVFAFSDDRSVQVLSGAQAIAWRSTPTHRRRYLHELVDLAEGADSRVSLLAREELRRVMGHEANPIGTTGGWRMAALAGSERLEPDGTGTVLFPVAERSAQALGGPVQDLNLSAVSRAVNKVMTLVGDRYLPAPVAQMLGHPAREGS